MLRMRLWLPLALLGSAGLPAVAVADYAEEMAELVRQGRPQEAYLLGQRHVLEGEGDPRFDLPFGLAAIDSGQASLGVFALERYLLANPNDLRARLELARGYFLLEEYDRARRDFERVLAASPPDSVRENVERFLDVIRLREGRYRTTSSYFVELGLGYDSNVNNAPDDPSFSSPVLGPGTLAGSSLADEDSYFDIAAGASLMHPIRPGVALFGGVDGSYKSNFDADDYNLGALNLKAGVAVLRQDDAFRVSLQGQDYSVGDEEYRRMLAVNAEWRRHLDPLTQIVGFVNYADLKYPDNELRDAGQTVAGLGFVKSFPGAMHPQLFASVYGGRERADGSGEDAAVLVDRDLYGVRVGVSAVVAPKVSVDLTGQWQGSDYRNEDPLFQRSREDDLFNAELGVNWLFQRHWRLRGSVGYSRNDSNIEVNEYDRTNARLSLRYEF